MRVLLLGGGGREHALARAIVASPQVSALWVAPGNGGIAALAECVALDPCDPGAVTAWAQAQAIDLVVIGPEAPLAAGVSDALVAAGVPVFGPSAAAARVETSKTFTKELCDACGAPTAAWTRVGDADAARAYVRAQGAPIVLKADGLAAGKGVIVALDLDEALAGIDTLFDGGVPPGGGLVIEAFMSGEEASLFVLTDGVRVLPLAGAQDHKRAFDGDTGPNTGGMGAYSPAPVLTPAVEALALERIIRPCLAELARRGTPYRGILYAGLMIEGGQPRLVEFNARFGDPEAQVVLPRLASDLVPALLAVARGDLAGVSLAWRPEACLGVVLAARGYPGPVARGEAIGGLEAAAAVPGVTVYHAGTRREAGTTLSAGGRVLTVTALGADLAQARARAYQAVDAIDWPGGFCRRDIGWRALG